MPCKNNNKIPYKNLYYNKYCNWIGCKYLVCIPKKIKKIEEYLKNNNLVYQKKMYDYNCGKGCRQFGEITFYIINIMKINYVI